MFLVVNPPFQQYDYIIGYPSYLPFVDLPAIGVMFPSNDLVCDCVTQDENAIKAKLRRLCEAKKDGKLQVPQWLHDEWRNGDHLKLARELESCGFDKAIVSPINPSIRAKHQLVETCCAPKSTFFSSFPLLFTISLQDRFVKYKTKTLTKTDRTTNDVSVGWYTKEDMQKVLKWNPKLFRIV